MTAPELKALADGLIPLVRAQMERGFEQERIAFRKMIDALELRLLEVETRPATIGPAGPQGEAGKDGAAGLDGKDGAPGLNGKDGAAGLDGKDGAPGLNGKDGAAGLDGKDGAPGLRGEKGETADPHELLSLTAAIDQLTTRCAMVEDKAALAHRLESDVLLTKERMDVCETVVRAKADDLSSAELPAVFAEVLAEAMAAIESCAPGL